MWLPKWADKVWMWKGWVPVKFPFAVLLVWLFIYLMVQMNERSTYDQEVLDSVREQVKHLRVDMTDLKGVLQTDSSAVKNVHR